MGVNPAYREAAKQVAQLLAAQNIEIVFGGGKVGLMGHIADVALAAGGKVTGIIPSFLSLKEVAHPDISEMIQVENMHQRKALMYDKSDGFIVLPGGTGTLDEFFEILTWSQLGLHIKPIGILNVAGYFDPMITQLDRMVKENFLHIDNRNLVVDDSEVIPLMEKMKNFISPAPGKWLDRSKL